MPNEAKGRRFTLVYEVVAPMIGATTWQAFADFLKQDVAQCYNWNKGRGPSGGSPRLAVIYQPLASLGLDPETLAAWVFDGKGDPPLTPVNANAGQARWPEGKIIKLGRAAAASDSASVRLALWSEIEADLQLVKAALAQLPRGSSSFGLSHLLKDDRNRLFERILPRLA